MNSEILERFLLCIGHYDGLKTGIKRGEKSYSIIDSKGSDSIANIH